MITAIALMTAALRAPPCPPGPMASSLSQAVGQTLTSVRGGNAHALLAQMSPEGVAFGGGVVAYAALAGQFGHEVGRYCDLFVCQGKAGRLNAFFNGGKMDRRIDTRAGRAIVVINAHAPRELDLGYTYSAQCKWQLSSIGVV